MLSCWEVINYYRQPVVVVYIRLDQYLCIVRHKSVSLSLPFFPLKGSYIDRSFLCSSSKTHRHLANIACFHLLAAATLAFLHHSFSLFNLYSDLLSSGKSAALNPNSRIIIASSSPRFWVWHHDFRTTLLQNLSQTTGFQ